LTLIAGKHQEQRMSEDFCQLGIEILPGVWELGFGTSLAKG
jgi:hypothetical protein